MKKLFKGILIFFSSVILLIYLILFLIYTPIVQRKAVELTSGYLKTNLGLDLKVDKFSLKFPLDIFIEGVSLNDSLNQPLVDLNLFKLEVYFWPLLKGEIKSDSIIINSLHVDSKDLIGSMIMKGDLGRLSISDTRVKFLSGNVDVETILIDNCDFDMTILESQEKKDTVPGGPVDWRIKLGNVDINGVGYNLQMPQTLMGLSTTVDTLRLSDGYIDLLTSSYFLNDLKMKDGAFSMKMGENQPDTIPGFNPNNFSFSNIAIDVDSFMMKDLFLDAHINKVSLKEGKGFVIKDFSGYCHYDPKSVKATKLRLLTTDSSISADVDFDFTLLSDKPEGTSYADLNASIGPNDIEYFIGGYVPDLKEIIQENALLAKTKIKSEKNNISISQADFKLGSLLDANITGKLLLAKDIKDISANLIIDAKSIPGSLNLMPDLVMPDTVTFNSDVDFRYEYINARAAISLDKSLIDLDAALGLKKYDYDINISTNNIDIKSIMPTVDIPQLAFTAKAKGEGFDFFSPQCNSVVSLEVQKINYGEFSFKDILLSASLEQSVYNLFFALRDKIGDIDIQANGKLSKDYVTGSLDMGVTNVDLQHLKVSEHSALLTFNTNIDYYTNYVNSYKVGMELDSVRFDLENVVQPIKKVDLTLVSNPDSTYVNLKNGDLSFFALIEESLTGITKDIDKFTTELKYMLDSGHINTVYLRRLLPQTLVQVSSGNSNIVHGFLKSNDITYDSFNASIINEKGAELKIYADIPEFKTSSMELRNSMFVAEMDSVFHFDVSSIMEGETEAQNIDLSLRGLLVKDSLSLKVNQKDAKGNVGFDIGLNAMFRNDTVSLNFDTMNPIILYKPWKINENNYIDYSFDNKVKANLLMQSPGGMSIFVQSDNNVDVAGTIALNAGIKDFNLADLSESLKDFPSMRGKVNVDIYAEALKDSIKASLAVAIDSFIYEKKPLDQIGIFANYHSHSNAGHNVESKIVYDSKEVCLLDLLLKQDGNIISKLGIHEFPLNIANPFIPDDLLALNGELNGYLDITGKSDAPIINGDLSFRDANINIGYANANLKLPDNKIDINNNILNFDNFRIKAYNNNPIVVNGKFDMVDFNNMYADIHVLGNNVELINVKKQRNKMLYGKMLMDVNTYIKGPVELLKITGGVNLLAGTDFTYVMLDSPVAAQNRVGNLVEFTNFNDTTLTMSNKDIKTLISGVDIALTLSIAPVVEIGIDLSANGSDRVELIGGGDLAFLMNPRGDMEMSGRYELSGGFVNYNLPVLPVAKKFDIQNGSYVEWRGNLLDPYINIVASERIRTTVTEDDKGSRVVNFDASIKIMNTLNNIDISFDISAPEDLAIQNQIASMTSEERAKQALSLIITQMYTGPGTTAKLNSNSALTAFIQKEINQFAGDNLGGIDISFGIDSYDEYGAGGEGGKRTDYSFRFSKKLFNDRFRIVVGASVSSGQDVQMQQGQSFINDIILEYTLDKSATRYLKLFHHTNYDSLLEGEIIETGIGVVLKRKVRKIRQLFIFNEQKRRERIAADPENKTN